MIKSSRSRFFLLSTLLLIVVVMVVEKVFQRKGGFAKKLATSISMNPPSWQAPDLNTLPAGTAGDLIRYGRELIASTSKYLGPHGSVQKVSNGMNCQNCHLDAGTRLYANSFAAVAATYPRYRERSGKIESVEFRINDCLQRSLNGKMIDSTGKEMQAMVAYIKWVGKDVQKGVQPTGNAVEQLAFLTRAADTAKGRTGYVSKCQKCHGANGSGTILPDSTGYVYPPVWGPHSYNTGAGMYRMMRLAGYLKNDMPFGATHQSPQLSLEEAWDIAAFVNSQPRPLKMFKEDWVLSGKKPSDYPYGPYKDSFSESQHKYGPYEPIEKAKKGTGR